MKNKHLLVITTCPDRASAEAIAHKLVDAKLAACINIIPNITSIYEWKGRRETGTELILLIKTCSSLYNEIERKIVEFHPYELPEVLAVSIKNGLAGYLSWIDESTSTVE